MAQSHGSKANTNPNSALLTNVRRATHAVLDLYRIQKTYKMVYSASNTYRPSDKVCYGPEFSKRLIRGIGCTTYRLPTLWILTIVDPTLRFFVPGRKMFMHAVAVPHVWRDLGSSILAYQDNRTASLSSSTAILRDPREGIVRWFVALSTTVLSVAEVNPIPWIRWHNQSR